MIDSYEFGEITVDGRAYSSDVIIYPDRVDDAWWREEGHRLCVADIGRALAAKPDVLVIGCGQAGVLKVPSETAKHIKSHGIRLVVADTRQACEDYNRLSAEAGMNVVAALHLTC